jgi:hypothetical protein
MIWQVVAYLLQVLVDSLLLILLDFKSMFIDHIDNRLRVIRSRGPESEFSQVVFGFLGERVESGFGRL